MKTKQQKEEEMNKAINLIENNESLILLDFSGLKNQELNDLRRGIKRSNGSFRVFKKNLLKLTLVKKGLPVDFLEDFAGQTGAAFTGDDFESSASFVFGFVKNSKNLKVVGGMKLGEKEYVAAEMVETIGRLPGREVLIAQVIGMISSPIRKFLYILDQRAKKVAG